MVRCQNGKHNKKPESNKYKAVNSVILLKGGEMVEGGREVDVSVVPLYVKKDDRTEEAILRSAFMRLAAQSFGGRIRTPFTPIIKYVHYTLCVIQCVNRSKSYRLSSNPGKLNIW